jgi:hypothetical protein
VPPARQPQQACSQGTLHFNAPRLVKSGSRDGVTCLTMTVAAGRMHSELEPLLYSD